MRRSQMLDQGEFGAGIEQLEVYLIHKRADEEDSATRTAEKVFRGERVGKRRRIETDALIGDADDQVGAGILERCGDMFFGVVGVAVEDGVDRRFPYRHG